MKATVLTILYCVFVRTLVKSELAVGCKPEECLGPTCRCSLSGTPGGYSPEKIPQVILLTYDDAVNPRNYPEITELLGDRKNPNGCPVTATFYVSHEYNDYSLVHELWRNHHEIASHSMSHKPVDSYWNEATRDVWAEEMNGMKISLQEFALIPKDEIAGMRSPFLKAGGNNMYNVTHNYFHYDISWPTRAHPNLFPYTLDFKSKQDCYQYPCRKTMPNETFPGTWVIPMIDLLDGRGEPCAMLDACIVLDSEPESVYQMLMDNFKRFYEGARAHMGLYLHHAWLVNPINKEAYIKFLDKMKEYDDVYFVTASQYLEWVKNPNSLDRIKEFEPWKTSCDDPKPSDCDYIENCFYTADLTPMNSERYMKICGECPPVYPWVNNPLGEA